ncbi:glutaredoxin family protein [Alteromonas sp. KS69]|jgi:glutaredoxin|uniref:MauE/DoxX family redox-associated membrane protein n=1 Tax=Alteromonas TaxID=226 RepID=UPI000E8CB311|nr:MULTISPECIES: glutaredoxin [Alteromonas]MCG7643591.1 glutaredoxin [Alteromonas sp. MmMcT2-2]RUP81456.1 glutaredoxin family protein [Alteromonas sp. KS69]HAU28181.1 glutaredoxin family protein [Alteromonas australica]|tara:strand:+ start:1064 stop:1795 length:732 start_codon:yes stop_codon:yes gene_type:complete
MSKKAILYRMVTKEHICPYGLRSKDLLEREGYLVEDNHLTSRNDTDDFKQKHGVETTPQTFIEEKRIGGYDELRKYFGKGEAGQNGTTYAPVIAIFSVAALLSLAFQFFVSEDFISIRTLVLFIAFSMTLLAVQKLKDLYSFTNSFITYDLLAMRWLRYGYIYPFLEAYAGIGMVAQLPAIAVAPFSLFIGTVGAISVFKAVYVDKRELKCACVGGDSNVPLGFVSLSENIFMIAGAFLMLSF